MVEQGVWSEPVSAVSLLNRENTGNNGEIYDLGTNKGLISYGNNTAIRESSLFRKTGSSSARTGNLLRGTGKFDKKRSLDSRIWEPGDVTVTTAARQVPPQQRG